MNSWTYFHLSSDKTEMIEKWKDPLQSLTVCLTLCFLLWDFCLESRESWLALCMSSPFLKWQTVDLQRQDRFLWLTNNPREIGPNIEFIRRTFRYFYCSFNPGICSYVSSEVVQLGKVECQLVFLNFCAFQRLLDCLIAE